MTARAPRTRKPHEANGAPVQAVEALPCNEEAELAFAGSVLLDSEHALKSRHGLCASDFWGSAKARAVFLAAMALHFRGEPADSLLIRRELERREQWTPDLAAFCASLTESVPTATNAGLYAKLIREASAQRAAVVAAHKVLAAVGTGQRPTAEVLEEAAAAIEYARGDSGEAPASAAWEWLKGDELAEEPDDAVEMLWPGLVAIGHVLLLAGGAKVGKSWLWYAYLGAMSRGEGWLGNAVPAAPARSVIVSEEPRSRVKAKLRRFGVRGAIVLCRGGAPSGAAWAAIVAEAGSVAEREGAKIVTFETLGGLAGIEDENDAAEGNRAMKPMLDLAGRGTVAVAATHHAPHSVTRQGPPAARARATTYVRGSGSLAANVDAVAALDIEDDATSPRRLLLAEGRFDTPPVRVVIAYCPPVEGETPADRIPATYRLVGAPADVAAERETRRSLEKVDRLDDRIVAFLNRERAWHQRGTILGRLACEKGAGGKRLHTLADLGRIQRTGLGTSRKDPFRFAALGVQAPPPVEAPGPSISKRRRPADGGAA